MKLGVIIGSEEYEFAKVAKLGIPTVQLWLKCTPEHLTEERLENIKKFTKQYNIEISAAWLRWPGNVVWNLYEGQQTLGLVPIATRSERIKSMKLGADFAKKLGITDVVTHVGFLPENPMTTEYLSLVTDLRELANYIKSNGQYFLFETGQETPMTLLRMIEDIGTGNLGVNLDPANLYVYGRGNPVDALDLFGKYVRGVHVKDGKQPTNGRELGEQCPLREGKVDFPKLFDRLKNEFGYDGALTLEREISDEEQQGKDLHAAADYVTGLWNGL